MEDIFNGHGIEIEIKEKDDFLKIRETLNKLFQSCHILHKRGRYAILHFKELFLMDGLQSDITDNDLERRNTIVGLLEEWDLLEILDENYDDLMKASLAQIKIIPHKEKAEWELIPKYHIGKK